MIRRLCANSLRLQSRTVGSIPIQQLKISELRELAREHEVSLSECLEKEDIIETLTLYGVYDMKTPESEEMHINEKPSKPTNEQKVVKSVNLGTFSTGNVMSKRRREYLSLYEADKDGCNGRKPNPEKDKVWAE